MTFLNLFSNSFSKSKNKLQKFLKINNKKIKIGEKKITQNGNSYSNYKTEQVIYKRRKNNTISLKINQDKGHEVIWKKK